MNPFRYSLELLTCSSFLQFRAVVLVFWVAVSSRVCPHPLGSRPPFSNFKAASGVPNPHHTQSLFCPLFTVVFLIVASTFFSTSTGPFNLAKGQLISNINTFLRCKVTYLQIPGIMSWTSLGVHYSAFNETHVSPLFKENKGGIYIISDSCVHLFIHLL